ncbi:MAG: 5'(3')-deoxyribonucleotidase [Bernardetiaceae bacterium]|jgi:5'(3')-deoxyribonucleotidase|nr:5'(3')-deoxyribonucleotidase [Bernardetiaceae bacterium]
MQRIAIDMDDVLADATGRFIEYVYQRHGVTVARDELRTGLEQKAGVPYSQVREWLYEDGFFRGMAVIPGSQDVVARLMQKYEVFIVSAAIEFPQSLREKVEWLAEHFPFINWKHIVLCGHKYMIQADYLIDDHEKNLAAFPGKPVVYTAPHNVHLTAYTRVNNWAEVAELFL